MSDGETFRTVHTHRERGGLTLYVEEWERGEAPAGRHNAGRFAFVECSAVAEWCDDVRGDVPDPTGSTAVFYIGETHAKNYWQSRDPSDLPLEALSKLHGRGYTLWTGVGGGWAHWDGRPEWSDKYVDFTDASEFDIGAEITERHR